MRDRVMRRAWLLGTALAAVALAAPAAADPMVTTVAPAAVTPAPAAGTGFQIYLFGDEPSVEAANSQAGETQPSLRLGGIGEARALTWFTPRVSGLGLGLTARSAGGTSEVFSPADGSADGSIAVGLNYDEAVGKFRVRAGMSSLVADGDTAREAPFGRQRLLRDDPNAWQVGAAVGYSNFQVGANFGDTTVPQCTTGGKCEGGDFWDIGLAYNFGSANLSAGYFSSGAGSAAAGTNRDVGIWSFNAGYKLLPNMDVYGGVNWVDIERGANAGKPNDGTVFLLGTNVRF